MPALTDDEILNDLTELTFLLRDEDHWIQGVLAVTDNRVACGVHNERACRWCLTGGLARVTGANGGLSDMQMTDRYREAGRYLTWALYLDELDTAPENPLLNLNPVYLPNFNDDSDTTHADVIELIHTAISIRYAYLTGGLDATAP